MTDRAALLDRFAARTRWADAARHPLAGDASARRYERWKLQDTSETCVLMDAPPERGESVAPFVRIARYLVDSGFNAPNILVEDTENGFLLIEDFGDGIFARLIEDDLECEAKLYEAAVDVLVGLQRITPPDDLIRFTPALMAEQASLVLETYADRSGKIDAFRHVLETILAQHVSGSKVMILRDYHAENLIWNPDREGIQRVGLLDFQDAMAGPVGYDLVSLIYDARRDVSPELTDRLVARFVAALDLDAEEFEAARAVLCAQRNLRIVAVFARLAKVQGKTSYLTLMPRVWDHLTTAMQHPALKAMVPFVAEIPAPDHEFLNRLRSKCTPTCL